MSLFQIVWETKKTSCNDEVGCGHIKKKRSMCKEKKLKDLKKQCRFTCKDCKCKDNSKKCKSVTLDMCNDMGATFKKFCPKTCQICGNTPNGTTATGIECTNWFLINMGLYRKTSISIISSIIIVYHSSLILY